MNLPILKHCLPNFQENFENKSIVKVIEHHIAKTLADKEVYEAVKQSNNSLERSSMIAKASKNTGRWRAPLGSSTMKEMAYFLSVHSAQSNDSLKHVVDQIDFSVHSHLYSTSAYGFNKKLLSMVTEDNNVRIMESSAEFFFYESLDLIISIAGLSPTLTLMNEMARLFANKEVFEASKMSYEKLLEAAVYCRDNPDYPIEWLISVAFDNKTTVGGTFG